jgi:glycosyltransferase involved in cell wall biosynthesis
MKVAFYAPMKPPHHPVPSGDRTMARALLKALSFGGADVQVVSGPRSFATSPSVEALEATKAAAREQIAVLRSGFEGGGWRPDVWLTYHPYYKAPDLIGPELTVEFNLPYATVEASYSERRGQGAWKQWHLANLAALERAAIHFVMTERDRAGLERFAGVRGELVSLPPFIDVTGQPPEGALSGSGVDGAAVRLIVVAMMRADVKRESYRMLATALGELREMNWTLDIVGDGAARSEVEDCFRDALGVHADERLHWHGELDIAGVQHALARGDLFVWPGFDEGYGLSYLEAQAMGLPVVAQRAGGVPAVVIDGETGFLTPEGDVAAYAQAIGSLIADPAKRANMAARARDFVWTKRSLMQASEILMTTLRRLVA